MPTLKAIAIAPQILQAMQSVEEAGVTVHAGISGDARGNKRDRQVTILFEDDWNDAVAETGECAARARRAAPSASAMPASRSPWRRILAS